MRKIILPMLSVLTLGAICFGGTTNVRAATWNETTEVSVTEGAFTYNAYLSEDGKESWIHNIVIDSAKVDVATMKIPTQIKDATVTKLGEALDTDEYSEFQDSILGVTIEEAHGCDGGNMASRKVKGIVIPETVTEITYGAFSGFDSIEKISLPDGIRELAPSVFYDCDNLKEIKMPANLETLELSALEDCNKLKTIMIPETNQNFKFEKNMLFTKNGKKLLWISPTKKKVTIPAKVTKLSDFVLNRRKLTDVKVAKKNKTFKREGQSIYRKKDKNLIAVISKNGTVKISSKVKAIGKCSVSVVGKKLKKVTIPKSVKDVYDGWLFFPTFCKIYFQSKKPPVIHSQYEGWEYTCMPIHEKVYVPKGAKKNYVNWATQRGLEFWDLHTYSTKKI